MVLNLGFEFSYTQRPQVRVRLRHADAWVDNIAMLDTGAAISLFDDEIAYLFGLAPQSAERHVSVVGVGGTIQRVPCWTLEVAVLPEASRLATSILIGMTPGLGKLTGNLLGRGFLEAFHFGLAHRERVLYLGTTGRSPRGP